MSAPASVTSSKLFDVSFTLLGDAGGNVNVEVAGKKYNANVNEGVAKVTISGLTAGNKVLKYTYAGDPKYVSVSGSKTLKVVAPPKVTVSLKKVTVKRSAKKLVIQATVKQGKTLIKNKKVTFKFNGKKYTAKTNKKGIAKVTIKKAVLKKLKVGKKVKYAAAYGKTTAKKTVKVKK